MTELLIVGGLLAAGLYVTRNSDNPLFQIPQTTDNNTKQVSRNLLAYVKDAKGAPLYESVADTPIPQSGYGRDYMLTLPVKTYVGKTTGNFSNGLIELTTTINTQKINFWVSTLSLEVVDQAKYDCIKDSKVLPKSEDVRMKLLKY